MPPKFPVIALSCCLMVGGLCARDASAQELVPRPLPARLPASAPEMLPEPSPMVVSDGVPSGISPLGLQMPELDPSDEGSVGALQVDLLGLPELNAFPSNEMASPGSQAEVPGATNVGPSGMKSGEAKPLVQHSLAELGPNEAMMVRTIPAFSRDPSGHRLVQYDVPLEDHASHQAFRDRGFEGRLMKIDADVPKDDSVGATLKRFWNPVGAQLKQKKVSVVRYEVPAEDIDFHSHVVGLDGEILEPSMLRLPEVRFFQPKARIFSDLKRGNDDEFDLFSDGAILASLDVVELYFPMPLISERFAEAFGKSSRLSSLGWRVGGTFGLGITTALKNGIAENGSAPVSTVSGGIRYEFPLGRPSREVLETGDVRLDQRTRVGIECGIQGGFSTRETLRDRTDVGMYFGILVNTPWGA